MSYTKRRPASGKRSRRKFNNRASKTARINVAGPTRGGIRL